MGQRRNGLTLMMTRTTGPPRRLSGQTGQKRVSRTPSPRCQSTSTRLTRNPNQPLLHRSKLLPRKKHQGLFPNLQHLLGQTLLSSDLERMRIDKQGAPVSLQRAQLQNFTHHQQARHLPRPDRRGLHYPQSTERPLSRNPFNFSLHTASLPGSILCTMALLDRLRRKRSQRTTSTVRGEKSRPVRLGNSTTPDLVGMSLCPKPKRDLGEVSSTSARHLFCRDQHITSKWDRQNLLRRSRLAGQAPRTADIGNAAVPRRMLAGEAEPLVAGRLLAVSIICTPSLRLKSEEDLR